MDEDVTLYIEQAVLALQSGNSREIILGRLLRDAATKLLAAREGIRQIEELHRLRQSGL